MRLPLVETASSEPLGLNVAATGWVIEYGDPLGAAVSTPCEPTVKTDTVLEDVLVTATRPPDGLNATEPIRTR